MIEVYAFSKLKQITEKLAPAHELTTFTFKTRNICHSDWIHPLKPEQHYRALEYFHFSAGSMPEFEMWKEGLCRFIHGCSLREFLEVCTPNNYFYPLLTCSPVETIWGSTLCKSVYADFGKFWHKTYSLHQSDIDQTRYFIGLYLNWMHATWVGSKRGCLELG